jgi:hypothetical protein
LPISKKISTFFTEAVDRGKRNEFTPLKFVRFESEKSVGRENSPASRRGARRADFSVPVRNPT